jgi:hypothetical protein
LKVLVACEFSGIVRDAFIRAGHDAVSCDLIESERPGPHTRKLDVIMSQQDEINADVQALPMPRYTIPRTAHCNGGALPRRTAAGCTRV